MCRKCALSDALLALVVVICFGGAVQAAVHDLAADFSIENNPSGVWTYGYLNSGGFNHDYRSFLTTGNSDGFVAYDEVANNGFGGMGWTDTGPSGTFGFPFSGVWNVPPGAIPFPGLTDFPSAAGDNPAYPNGVLGGHAPNCSFCSGWYAVKYTAAANETIDLDYDAWQTAIYPNVPPNPTFGGATRPQQTLVQKQVGATRTNLLRAPVGTRHGVTNRDGTPEHTFADAPTPGTGESFASQQDEIDAAMRSSANPNEYRLTNIQLNAGDSVIISYAPYQGNNHVGFLGFNAQVRSGADRIATTRWDLSNDWSTHSATATGIGPDAAWSYGILRSGAFSPYSEVRFGGEVVSENAGTAERENHGWGTQEPGWFAAEAINVAEGPITPGMVKDSDGVNALTGGFAAGTFSLPPTGDWTGSNVVLHTPTAEVDPAQTSVVRWTAPRSMSVNASGSLWRATLPDANDRQHQYQLLKNGTAVASGTIDELSFDCGAGGTNSACGEEFNVTNISVVQGDRLDLQISPRSGGGNPVGDYNNNGTVDAADYVLWRKNNGTSNALPNDPLGVPIGPGQYTQWRANFGKTGGGGGPTALPSFVGVDFTIEVANLAGTGTLAPEPSTALLLVVVGMAAALARPDRRSK